MANSSIDLEELRIQTLAFDNLVRGISDMERLTNLHTLEMADYWEDIEQLNEIALTNLKQLWNGSSVSDIPNQQSIIGMAVALKLLKSFKCNLEFEYETVLEFISHGTNLSTICMEITKNIELTPNLTRPTIYFYRKGLRNNVMQMIMHVKL